MGCILALNFKICLENLKKVDFTCITHAQNNSDYTCNGIRTQCPHQAIMKATDYSIADV